MKTLEQARNEHIASMNDATIITHSGSAAAQKAQDQVKMLIMEIASRSFEEGWKAAAEEVAQCIENHSCVSTCCEAQPGGETAKQLAECIRNNKGG